MQSCEGYNCPLKNSCEKYVNRFDKGNHHFFLKPPFVDRKGEFYYCPEYRMKPTRNGKQILPDNDPLLD